MEREYLSIDHYLEESTKKDNKENILATFFQKKNYEPKTDTEKLIIENFSFIAAAMSLLIHITMKKGHILEQEKNEIISRLVFQLRQRPFERANYSEDYGKAELNIVSNLYDKLLDEYENNRMDIEDQIDLINFVYQNNQQKRFFIVRLFFYIAFADRTLEIIELDTINMLAKSLSVDDEDIKRIKAEVIEELKLR
ncbi:MAG TPA: TerB family tellurite resistance protein [Candidatus Cloacimonadota bacterium]|nr:TerB family tellurite resistance protein [Candidatus Cloacimonadota bacterium]HOQ80247.1 TerB family tellurite resistance protein [Candidatus Cloacimonadota bacterium]